MEQSSPGRRRARDGAITVAELVSRQPSAVREALHQLGVERVDAETTENGVGDAGTGSGTAHMRSRLVPRIAVVTVCALALCGAVTAAAMITGGRTGQFAQRGSGAEVIDSGVDQLSALRPDMLGRDPATAWGSSMPASTTRGQPSTTTERVNTPISPPTVSAITPPPTTPTPTTSKRPEIDPAIDLVQRFFKLLPLEPNSALGLLEPRLLGDDRPGVLSAWKSVTYISVQRIESRPDDKVFAAVILNQSHGRRTYMEQLLTVSRTNPKRITDLQLISAQRI